jgi:excisionase family DNA binding protein
MKGTAMKTQLAIVQDQSPASDVIDLTKLPPTVDIVTAARILGVGRTVAYELVREGTWPTEVIRLGRKIRIPSSPLLNLVGIDSTSRS